MTLLKKPPAYLAKWAEKFKQLDRKREQQIREWNGHRRPSVVQPVFMTGDAQIKLALLTGEAPLNKRYYRENGAHASEPGRPIMYAQGLVLSLTSLREVLDAIAELSSNQVIISGLPKGLEVPEFGIASKKYKAEAGASGAHLVTRDRGSFDYPAGPTLLWFDMDRAKGSEEVAPPHEFDPVLCRIVPPWAAAERAYSPSGGAFISYEGQRVTGLSGQRIRLVLDRGADYEAVAVAINDRLWEARHGRIEFSSAGTRLVRGPFDMSKLGPESIDYAGQPDLAKGYSKAHRAPALFGMEGGMLSARAVLAAARPGCPRTYKEWLRWCPEVRAAMEAALPESKQRQAAYVDAKVEEAVETARAQSTPFDEATIRTSTRHKFEQAQQFKLEPDFILYMSHGGTLTVAEVMKDFHGERRYKESYCADPIEPEYQGARRNVATIHYNQEGPVIYSHAHGGGRFFQLGNGTEVVSAVGTKIGATARHLEFVTAADMPEEDTEWFWPDYIPFGELTGVTGPTEIGKSHIFSWLTALATTGSRFPNNAGTCSKGWVIYLSAEENPQKTVIPRLRAQGADLNKVRLLMAAKDEKGSVTRMSLKQDIERIDAEINRLGNVPLVIIDPITSYADDTNPNADKDVRELLDPLNAWIHTKRTALLFGKHHKKGKEAGVGKTSGSGEWTNVPRAVFSVLPHPLDHELPVKERRRLFCREKNSLGGNAPTIAFRIETALVDRLDDNSERLGSWDVQTGSMRKTSKLNMIEGIENYTADEAYGLKVKQDEELIRPAADGGKLERQVKAALREILSGCPKTKEEVRAALLRKNLPGEGGTVTRACLDLGIKKEGGGRGRGASIWSLPNELTESKFSAPKG